jgi:hypothetical protein
MEKPCDERKMKQFPKSEIIISGSSIIEITESSIKKIKDMNSYLDF